jgi:putative membrane protein
MRSVLVKIAVNAVAIWVAAAVVPGVDVSGRGTARTIATLAVVGALFGLVNAFIKPVVKFFSFPFYILTLGLFAFVVNAVMLEIVSWISGKVGISFHIGDFFWSAILAAVVVTVVSMALNLVMPEDD